MKVIGIDDREYSFPLPQDSKNKILENRSHLHTQALEILKEIFPTQIILEEVKIPGSRLKLDIYVPTQRIAIEVQGPQHYIFSKFFHQGLFEFKRAIKRDMIKEDWCLQNNIILIALSYREIKQWPTLIKQKL